ncbi:MAG: hypothetical protein H0V81_07000 [Solirubrobacterales bacterium]|nr:hypothetical protein [Solirubrobacterales bacterium]
MKFRRILSLMMFALVALVFAACGDEESTDTTSTAAPAASTPAEAPADDKLIKSNPENGSVPQITIGSKNFTEQFILGEIYAQSLEAAGYKIKKQLNLGSEQIAFKALKTGDVDAYPEYVGTALTSFFDVKSAEVPKETDEAYSLLQEKFAEENLDAAPVTPFTDTNAFAMSTPGWEKAGKPKTLSDLAPMFGELTLSGSPECRSREDCKLGVEEAYGEKFGKYLPVALDKRHEVLTSGDADVSVVFGTDGQIATENLVVLEDDKKFLPPYNVSLVTREKTLEAAGEDYLATITKVQEGLTDEVMQELNSRVDLDKEDPADVAATYLKESGYTE